MAHLGLIGGSGFYSLPLEGAEWRAVDTSWAAPSDAMVTDYDPWRDEGHGPVDLSAILDVLAADVARDRDLAARIPAMLPALLGRHPSSQGCDHAIVTAANRRDPLLLERLRAVAGRLL